MFMLTKVFTSKMFFKIGNDPVRQLPQVDLEAFRPEILFPEDEEDGDGDSAGDGAKITDGVHDGGL